MQAISRQPQRAPNGAPVHYERHRPEQTTLYRLVQQHAATFFAQAEDAAGADLPQFVKDEFDAFFECGILAHGFLRLRAGTLDRSDELAVVAHIWVKREQPWLKLPADVPAWPEGAPVAELVQALSSGPRDR